MTELFAKLQGLVLPKEEQPLLYFGVMGQNRYDLVERVASVLVIVDPGHEEAGEFGEGDERVGEDELVLELGEDAGDGAGLYFGDGGGDLLDELGDGGGVGVVHV